jgi:hypothetical protein
LLLCFCSGIFHLFTHSLLIVVALSHTPLSKRVYTFALRTLIPSSPISLAVRDLRAQRPSTCTRPKASPLARSADPQTLFFLVVLAHHILTARRPQTAAAEASDSSEWHRTILCSTVSTLSASCTTAITAPGVHSFPPHSTLVPLESVFIFPLLPTPRVSSWAL